MHVAFNDVNHLLFLNDLSLFVEELHLLLLILGLDFVEEVLASPVSSVYALHEAHGVRNLLVVPLDSQHTPVRLNVDGRLSLLFAVLLGLTIHKQTHNHGFITVT